MVNRRANIVVYRLKWNSTLRSIEKCRIIGDGFGLRPSIQHHHKFVFFSSSLVSQRRADKWFSVQYSFNSHSDGRFRFHPPTHTRLRLISIRWSWTIDEDESSRLLFHFIKYRPVGYYFTIVTFVRMHGGPRFQFNDFVCVVMSFGPWACGNLRKTLAKAHTFGWLREIEREKKVSISEYNWKSPTHPFYNGIRWDSVSVWPKHFMDVSVIEIAFAALFICQSLD